MSVLECSADLNQHRPTAHLFHSFSTESCDRVQPWPSVALRRQQDVEPLVDYLLRQPVKHRVSKGQLDEVGDDPTGGWVPVDRQVAGLHQRKSKGFELVHQSPVTEVMRVIDYWT